MRNYYVTPYENGSIIEREGEGTISVHKEEIVAIRRACELAESNGAQVFVRKAQPGRCRPYCEPPSRPTGGFEKLGWRDRVMRMFDPTRYL